MTVTQLMLHKRMLEKNFNIKQRFVNEAKPFCSYNSQNLFKLPGEKGQRTRLIDGDPALVPTPSIDKDLLQ